ncbi:cytosine permease [Gluconacetobacter azotocaptans]|nr:cytosine permease [Gluconacetobacter azotocaptans]MBM9402707.1 cytosine permease [Gluconacetobacter azotocaptans]GBQ26935.1 cytosine/purines/uracil/thiamine/allantoin transporter [Gluconacetobacter azotocaptans DSM 13594]
MTAPPRPSVGPVIEAETIFPIPHDRRHGRTRDLFTVWCGSNMMMLTIVTGALSTGLFGLSIGPALLAILLGSLVGGVVMALHAAQGPMLGVPQMVQTRGQFGSVGAVPIVILATLMYLGFTASNLVLGGETLRAALPGLGRVPAVLAIGVCSMAPTIFGYRGIHAGARALTWLGGLAILYALARGLPLLAHLAALPRHGSFLGFLGALSTAALWQIAYAPNVSDSSRYLPATTDGGRRAFAACYAGSVTGSVLPMTVGALLGPFVRHDDVTGSLAGLVSPHAVPVLAVLALGIAISTAMNIYCAALSSITIVQTFATGWRPGRAVRLGLTAGILLLSLGVALLAERHFFQSYTTFLEMLMAFLVPWTAVNLVDYYLVRRGAYDVAAFFRADGGIYGRFNTAALLAYGFGLAVQFPFLTNGYYTGPAVPLLHGVDISWIVGLALTTPAYLWLLRAFAPVQKGGTRVWTVVILMGLLLPVTGARAGCLDDVRRAGVLTSGTGLLGDRIALWQDRNGEYHGVTADLFFEIARRMGVPQARFIPTEWPTLIPGLKARRWDIVLSDIVITQERIIDGNVLFSTPYFRLYDRVIVLGDSPIRTTDDLRGKTLGSVVGSTDSMVAHGLVAQGYGASVSDYNNWADPFQALRNRQIDAVILDQDSLLSHKDEFKSLRVIGDPLFYQAKPAWQEAERASPYYLGDEGIVVRPACADLRAALNNALEAMRADGTLKAILKKNGVWEPVQDHLIKPQPTGR